MNETHWPLEFRHNSKLLQKSTLIDSTARNLAHYLSYDKASIE
jgi:hypothetical protein